MRIVLDNKSYHDAIVTLEGKTYNLRPQQIVYAEVYNTQPLNVKIEHRYISYIDCRHDYILVITSEYNLNGVTDGAILSIAHDRSKFSSNGVYERFFISFPLMYSCAENHTVTNFEEIYKKFKRSRRGWILFQAAGDVLFDFGFPCVPPIGLVFILVWIFESFEAAVKILFQILAIAVCVFLFVSLPLTYWMENSGKYRRRRKRRKGRNIEENHMIEDLKGICESAAISAYYADPYRNIIPVGSNYEG